MRGIMGTVIVFLVCLIVVVLYLFLGKGQLGKAAVSLEMQLEEQDIAFENLQKIRKEIPVLKASLPIWREQLEIFTTAIPQDMNDHVFFSNLVTELEEHPGVSLLSFNSNMGGPWITDVSPEVEAKLTEYKIDIESAKSIRCLFINLRLIGDFDEVLTIIENLKKYRRLYTIDMVAAPTGGGSGTVTSNNQPEITPIQFTGRLYFNLPDPKVDINELNKMYLEVLAGMLQNDIVVAGQEVLKDIDFESVQQPGTRDDIPGMVLENENVGSRDEKQGSDIETQSDGDIALARIGNTNSVKLKDRLL